LSGGVFKAFRLFQYKAFNVMGNIMGFAYFEPLHYDSLESKDKKDL
jgi:hypothetical protein